MNNQSSHTISEYQVYGNKIIYQFLHERAGKALKNKEKLLAKHKKSLAFSPYLCYYLGMLQVWRRSYG